MAGYNSVPQADVDVTSNASSSSDDPDDRSPRLKPTAAFEPLSIDFDNLGGGKFMQDAKVFDSSNANTSDTNFWTKKPGSVLSFRSSGIVGRSRGTSVSYDIVEDDDYNVVVADPQQRATASDRQSRLSQAGRPHDSMGDYRHPSADMESQPPLQRVQSVPLAHPTPDLQSIQGAYVGNVERLEKSAETFDLASETKKPHGPDQPSQRPMSSRSRGSRSSSMMKGTSVSARSGVYTQDGGFASPRRSIHASPVSQAGPRARSGSVASRLARVVEPVDEHQHEEQTQVVPTMGPPDAQARQFDSQYTQQHDPEYISQMPDGEQYERPGSAGSGDTYLQARDLFRDFDGVHYHSHRRDSIPTRRISLSQPPLASQPERYDEPAPGMVYYPAPVPMVLNLPQRLSRRPPPADHEKRVTQVVNSLGPEAKKSAAWLFDHEPESSSGTADKSHRQSEVPSHLRASAFFEQKPVQLNIDIREQSAVDTLDRILDASAHAPVAAFTYHPIVGEAGEEVYENENARKKSREKKHRPVTASITNDRGSVAPSLDHIRRGSEGLDGPKEGHAAETAHEEQPFRTSYERDSNDGRQFKTDRFSRFQPRGGDEYNDECDRSDAGSRRGLYDEEGQKDEAFIGRPATLIAELQMRKQEQKQRNRTAATAFPGGMHSTLLELDAVAQRQRQHRKQKHVTLAWQEPGVEEHSGSEDEDIPLGVLFPEQNKTVEEQRPLGLMEQLELEENEPLSRRRARIRGEVPEMQRPYQAAHRNSMAHTLDARIPEANNSEDSDEDETLAQRIQRLKARGATPSDQLTSDFANEVLSRFKSEPETSNEQQGEEPEAEETLAQRRSRLQAEAAAAGHRRHPSNFSRSQHTIASVLQAPPIHQPSLSVGDHPSQVAPEPSVAYPSHHRMSMATTAQGFPMETPGYYPMQGDMPYNLPYRNRNATPYGNGLSAVNPAYIPSQGQRMSFAQIKKHAEQQHGMLDERRRAIIDRWRFSVV
ncbi:hypothetical protein VTO42DRAFT_5522 [Malbranchea cinnamomea]